MFTKRDFVALLLGANVAFAAAASLEPSVVTAITPTPIESATKSTATTTLSADASAKSDGVISISTHGSPKPITASTKHHGSTKKVGGFSASIKKKPKDVSSGAAATKRSLRARDDFGSDIEYSWLAVLEVGSPSQTLDLLLDLGSDGFVVLSTLEPEDVRTTNYPIYNPLDSTTALQQEGYTWSTGYVSILMCVLLLQS